MVNGTGVSPEGSIACDFRCTAEAHAPRRWPRRRPDAGRLRRFCRRLASSRPRVMLTAAAMAPILEPAGQYPVPGSAAPLGREPAGCVPGLPGGWSRGDPEQEALANIGAAIRDYLTVKAEQT